MSTFYFLFLNLRYFSWNVIRCILSKRKLELKLFTRSQYDRFMRGFEIFFSLYFSIPWCKFIIHFSIAKKMYYNMQSTIIKLTRLSLTYFHTTNTYYICDMILMTIVHISTPKFRWINLEHITRTETWKISSHTIYPHSFLRYALSQSMRLMQSAQQPAHTHLFQ